MRRRWRRPFRQRLGLVDQKQERQGRDHLDAEPGQSAHGGQQADSWRGRLGARVLSELSEPPARLHQSLVERGELGRRRQELRERKITKQRALVFARFLDWVTHASRVLVTARFSWSRTSKCTALWTHSRSQVKSVLARRHKKHARRVRYPGKTRGLSKRKLS